MSETRDPDFAVRKANLRDAPRLAAIKRAIEDKSYSTFGSVEEHQRGLLDFCSQEYVAGLIEDARTTVLVAERSGESVGLAALTVSASCGRLHAVYSLERGGGVGRMLVSNAADLAIELGLTALCCEIFEANHGAVRFFTRLGFQASGQRPSETYSKQRLIKFRGDARQIVKESRATTPTNRGVEAEPTKPA